MAKLVFGMNQSLDGYVDHRSIGRPDDVVFEHFTETLRRGTGMVYGRNLYQIMRYWDDDQPDWDPQEQEFARLWRSKPKWVISRTLTSVGPNATLVPEDVESFVRALKAEQTGTIAVAGPQLAASLAGLIDEYRLYIHPVVLGSGTPYFAAPRPRLQMTGSERIGNDVVLLTYAPAPAAD